MPDLTQRQKFSEAAGKVPVSSLSQSFFHFQTLWQTASQPQHWPLGNDADSNRVLVNFLSSAKNLVASSLGCPKLI